MKKSFKLLSSIVLAATMVFSLFSPASFANEIDKLPDALNPEKEKQKIIELQQQASKQQSFGELKEARLYVHPDKPLVINFDDGSSITYTSKVTTNRAGTLSLSIEKTYTYLVGYAKIEGKVSGLSTINYDQWHPGKRGYNISSASASQSIVDTGYAEVTRGDSEFKTLITGLYGNKLRARHKGDILYEIAGVKKQRSYELIWESDPSDEPTPYIVSSY